MCYLCPCAVFVPWCVWILFKCGYIRFMLLVLFSLLCSGMQFWISCTTLIGHYIGSVLSLYVADFLLVYIYALRNVLRDKELRVVLVETWRI